MNLAVAASQDKGALALLMRRLRELAGLPADEDGEEEAIDDG